MTMNDNAHRPGRGDADRPGTDPRRLAAYEARTQEPLDLLALATLWLVVVLPSEFGARPIVTGIVYACRFALSAIYGIDIIIRSALASRHLRYTLTHPLALASVVAPPVRVFFSIRLVQSLFRRGNLRRFLLAATVMVLNGAVIVYLVERHAPHSNIHTLGDSLWWSAVTVTTVGYGDFYPVTTEGRITACLLMGIGLLTLAVVTAQVASSFVAEEPSKAAPVPLGEAARREVTLAELDQRLARIERLLAATATPSHQAGTRMPERGSEPTPGLPAGHRAGQGELSAELNP
jgi:voltage-gated potassium channel